MRKIFTSMFVMLLIVQSMMATTITLTEPNTLYAKATALGLTEASSLTVNGPLGYLDIAYINQYGNNLGLQHLDLSGATLYGDANSDTWYSGYSYKHTSGSTGFTTVKYDYFYISPTGQNYDSGYGTGPGAYTSSTTRYYRTDLPYAFKGITTLVSIKLPKGMNGIGEKCFEDCTSLTTVTPTDPIVNVHKDAFSNSGIASAFTEYNGVTYYGNYAMFPTESKATLTFKNGTTHIADNFMSGYTYDLTSVTFPSSLLSIGYNAFSNCSNLATITKPASIQYICDNAFSGCTSMNGKSLTLPASIVKIGHEALNTLGSITFDGTDNLQEIHTNAIPENCANLETVEGITYLGNIAFKGALTEEKESLWLREGTRLVAGGFIDDGDISAAKLHLPNTVTRLNYNALFNYNLSGTAMALSHSIKDVYIHSTSLVTLDAPINSQYRVTFHLLPSLESEYASRTDSWAYSAEDYIKFDLVEGGLGGETDGTDDDETPGTPDNIFSVEDTYGFYRRDEIPTGKVYVKGSVTYVEDVSVENGYATYYINDAPGDTLEIGVYQGRYIGNKPFTSQDQIKAGDEVVVYGNIEVTNGFCKFKAGNCLYSLNGVTTGITDITIDGTALNGKVIYNLSGRRVTGTPKKGIYIVDGKKVVF